MTHTRSKSLDTILWPHGHHAASSHSLPVGDDSDHDTSHEDDDGAADDTPAERPEVVQLRALPLADRLQALKVSQQLF